MQKIPTMFVRDESKPGHPVTDECKVNCLWVFHGEGVPTRKVDGTNVKIEQGQLLKRQKPKARDYDDAAYVLCDRANPADKWAFEAFDAMDWKADGIYELVGPKVQGNPHGYATHTLVRVLPRDESLRIDTLPVSARTFQGLREFLTATPIEGIVFHHPDGRMAKIKRRDFGLPWPARPDTPQVDEGGSR